MDTEQMPQGGGERAPTRSELRWRGALSLFCTLLAKAEASWDHVIRPKGLLLQVEI